MSDLETKGLGSVPDKEPAFAVIGEQIATALIEAAEAQMTHASNVLANAKVVADSIRAHIKEQSKLLSEANERLVLFSKSITDAHDKFNGKK